MEIREKYKSYGSIPHQYRIPLQLKHVLVALAVIVGFLLLVIAFLYVCFMRGFGKHFILLILFLAAMTAFISYDSRAKDSSFTADDASVTFTRKFAKDITIPYIDIDTVAVYTERKSGNGKSGSFYVETLLITMLDGQDYEFKTVMDIKPNGRLEATGFMDKMLEMGKFSVLKKHIEIHLHH